MKNFKEIAEKCLSGELSGTFIIRNHKPLHSKHLYRYTIGRDVIYGYYWLGGIVFDEKGENIPHKDRIQNFIPDNMQKKIEIDIPEGKVPAMEQTENGVVITWKDKELTYTEIHHSLWKNGKVINHIPNPEENTVENLFIKKVNTLRKLTNIRNYFGQPDGTKCVHYIYVTDKGEFKVAPTAFPGIYTNSVVTFKEKEHAEQAIKMLGDELKYLFEPW